MSDSMVERVAKAIYEASPRNKPWHSLMAYKRNSYMREARAALEAMREPTAAMLQAGMWSDSEDGKDIWRAMISKAMEG